MSVIRIQRLVERTGDKPQAIPLQCPLRIDVAARDGLRSLPAWRRTLAHERKDHRYFELVEDTLHPEFDYRYFVISDARGDVRAVQPFFLLDQDLLVGLAPGLSRLIDAIRGPCPRFMMARTLMVGCAAGEGHLDGDLTFRAGVVELLAEWLRHQAHALGARLIVLKEFPACYRPALDCLVDNGFARVPSMPMTKVSIDYASFEEYMTCALNSATRRKLRKKFQAAERAAPIDMSVVHDVTPHIAQIYPLYLQVYHRSKLRFEKLTEAYFCELGRRMPDKVRFFLWRQNNRIVAFSTCMVQGDAIYAEYIGLDYSVALDLHLYHYIYRDMIRWAISNGCKWFRSSGLNYDPKLHLRHTLDPIDLYVRHTSEPINAMMKRLLPILEPTRYDKTLAKFSNYHELWATY